MVLMIKKIDIELIYALPNNQTLKCLQVSDGTTVEQAITLSELVKLFPEIDITKNKIGIFGKLVKPKTVLNHRDRIEIYRPLIIDPKEARRKRAMKRL